MAGFFFYWISWSIWITVTFLFAKNHPYRFKTALFILIIIILSPYQFTLFQISMPFAIIPLIMISYIHYMKKSFLQLFTNIIRILIITIYETSYLLITLYDPVWQTIDPLILRSASFSLLGIVLFGSYLDRLFGTILGMIQGEIFYSFILKKWDIHYALDLALFDHLAIAFFFITSWHTFMWLKQYFYMKTNYSFEKEKQIL